MKKAFSLASPAPDLLGDLRLRVVEARAAGAMSPAIVGALATLQAEILLGAGLAAVSDPPEAAPGAPDRLLTAQELSDRLKVSIWSIYRAARTPGAYPFRVDLPGGRYRFSERGFEKWNARGGV